MSDHSTENGVLGTAALFDVQRYPVNQRGTKDYDEMVRAAHAGLTEHNCARLPNFIRPEVLDAMQAEATNLAGHATYTEAWLNPYFSDPPDNTPAGHPLRQFSLRQHGMIRGDRFSRDGGIWSAFQNEDLCRFVADCLGYETLHPYADPYGCVNVNVQPAGCEFAWHFDHNDFTVSIGLSQPEEGGVFEYVPDIRTTTDENYADVKMVLDGDRTKVRTLRLRPGDLQIFRGGYTLHRVTAPDGERRLSLLLSYVQDPAKIASPEYAQRLWGEAHPLHLTA